MLSPFAFLTVPSRSSSTRFIDFSDGITGSFVIEGILRIARFAIEGSTNPSLCTGRTASPSDPPAPLNPLCRRVAPPAIESRENAISPPTSILIFRSVPSTSSTDVFPVFRETISKWDEIVHPRTTANPIIVRFRDRRSSTSSRLAIATAQIMLTPEARTPPMIASGIIARKAANFEKTPIRMRMTPAHCIVIRLVTYNPESS